jgi:hypothetical protein
MARLHTVGEIQLSDDLPFSRKSWILERIGWAALGLLLAAGLAGLLGPGLFSKTRAGEPGGPIRVEFDRFERRQNEGTLRVELGPLREESGRAGLRIENRYLDGLEIESLRPEPVQVTADSGGTTFLFSKRGDGDGVSVVFEVRFKTFGLLAGRFSRPGGGEVEIRQFVYP